MLVDFSKNARHKKTTKESRALKNTTVPRSPMPPPIGSLKSPLEHVLVFGLGNATHPGTRHSVGQLLVDSLAMRLNARLSPDRSIQGSVAHASTSLKLSDGSVGGLKVTLAKSKHFMNVSGRSAALAVRTYLRPPLPTSLIVIHDSLSHKPFAVHPKFGGSANGHNGLKDITSHLGDQYHRLRIGIGDSNGNASEYVLDSLSKEEKEWWGPGGKGVDKVWEAIEKIARG